MKDKAMVGRFVVSDEQDDESEEKVVEPELEAEPGYDDMTAECFACGDSHVGVGVPVYMLVPGMLFPNRSFDVASFVPDPDVKMTTLRMPNEQLAFVTDQETTKFAHVECIQLLIDEAGNVPEEEEEEEDEDEDEEDEEEDA